MAKTKLTFNNTFEIFSTYVDEIVDHRGSNCSYTLGDVIRCGFAVFSLKIPSLLAMENRSVAQQNNMKSIYKIDNIPSDTSMRETLDNVCYRELSRCFPKLYKSFKRQAEIDRYKTIGNRLIVAIDGVEHFRSDKIKCEHCLTKTFKDGTVQYHHNMLAAVLVHPDQREVLPIHCEPIINKDGNNKNDCEQNASKRLLDSMLAAYGKERFILVEDALYANNPNISKIKSNKWSYLLRVKSQSHKTIFKRYEGRKNRKQLREYSYTDKSGTLHRYSYMNQVKLTNDEKSNVVNFLHYECIDTKGKQKIFDWITDIKITKSNVVELARMARSRWKIENETFNTLKNQGYNFNHNYGHGHNQLASVMAVLMLLSFAIDQLQQIYHKGFQAIMNQFKSRKQLWDAIKSTFMVLTVNSMDTIIQNIILNWKISLEDP